ncbi:MAG TPA: formylglycine-generating enzyme family protein [Pirellulales bacterium]|nr:formylglycine-generating enzyme family protein [Pirellulales bacterium]
MSNPRVPRRLAIACAALITASLAHMARADDTELLKTFRREFVDITPGQGIYPASFQMGRADSDLNERPAHKVSIKAPFLLARYEVPQDLWQAVMGSNPSRWKGPRNAVEMVSFDDAEEFCRRVTTQMRAAGLITMRQQVRLPSEAEWEYAARTGTQTVYSFGDDPGALNEHAWSTHNAAGNDPPVGARRPNAWQLYDMHGYLWEWCADAWHATYAGAPVDGSAWLADGDPARRVLRGGSWKDAREKLTSSFRRPADRQLKDDAVGLRCVLSNP